MTNNELPSFDLIFGKQAERLQGIHSWDNIALLGKVNIEQLIQIAQQAVYALMADNNSREELRLIQKGIIHLKNWLSEEINSKPKLVRLRVESFHQGDEVVIYIGDSEGCITENKWQRATITKVTKGYQGDWDDGSPNSGYHWRLTATSDKEIFPQQSSISFSTSEPRVLPIWEFEYLLNAKNNDIQFLQIFCDNAWRSWHPIWCLERGVKSSGERMDMKSWLLQPTPNYR